MSALYISGKMLLNQMYVKQDPETNSLLLFGVAMSKAYHLGATDVGLLFRLLVLGWRCRGWFIVLGHGVTSLWMVHNGSRMWKRRL